MFPTLSLIEAKDLGKVGLSKLVIDQGADNELYIQLNELEGKSFSIFFTKTGSLAGRIEIKKISYPCETVVFYDKKC